MDRGPGRPPGPNTHTLFIGLSLRLKRGESLVVVGPSGCGKSSLLRVIAGDTITLSAV